MIIIHHVKPLRTKRLIKAPKLYWGDTGVALHMSEMGGPGTRIWKISCCTICSPGAMRAWRGPS